MIAQRTPLRSQELLELLNTKTNRDPSENQESGPTDANPLDRVPIDTTAAAAAATVTVRAGAEAERAASALAAAAAAAAAAAVTAP